MPFKREDTKKVIKTGDPIQKEEKRLVAGVYDSVVRQEQCRRRSANRKHDNALE